MKNIKKLLTRFISVLSILPSWLYLTKKIHIYFLQGGERLCIFLICKKE